MNRVISFFEAVQSHWRGNTGFEAWQADCSFWDGHVREAALRQINCLTPQDLPQALPLVLRRLNDWVPQVRDQALSVLPQLMLDGLEPAWAAALPELERFARAQRQSPEPVLRRFDGYWFDREAGRAALDQVRTQLPQRTRRWLALREGQHLLRAGRHEALQRWLDHALLSSDPPLARFAAQELARIGLPPQELQRLRERALRAGQARLALQVARQWQSEGNLPATAWLALARRATPAIVQWLAHFADADTREQLVRQAQEQLGAASGAPRRRAQALALLLRLSPEAATACLPATAQSACADLRLLALQAGTPAGREADVLTALRDPASSVRRWGARRVLRGALPPVDAELQAVLTDRPAALPQVLNLLQAASPWRRAAWIWSLAADLDRPLPFWQPQLQRLQRSLEATFTQPTPEQLTQIRQSRERATRRWPELARWGLSLTELNTPNP